MTANAGRLLPLLVAFFFALSLCCGAAEAAESEDEDIPSSSTTTVTEGSDGATVITVTTIAMGTGADGAVFDDVAEDAWYAQAVYFVSSRGIFSGTGEATFSPNDSMSRAMLSQTLYNMEGAPTAIGRSKSFTDVGESWYADAVNWAAEKGIVSGYSDGSFGANDDMTREQLAVFLRRYAAVKGCNISVMGTLDGFSDSAETSPWAQDAVAWAVGAGLLGGKGDGTLDPQGTASRAEVAAVLMKYCQNIAGA